MPFALRTPDGSYMRRHDVKYMLAHLAAEKCVEVTGISNIGKSSLLRLLSQPDIWVEVLGQAGQAYLPVYIDCNRMLEMTDQGFYELVLRCFQESSAELASLPELAAAYKTLVAPASDFQIPLSFSRGVTAALKSSQRKLVLLFDEFDEPFMQIDSRVFLNLRAMKDRHGSSLIYVTATVHPLAVLRPEDHCGEFCELFSHQPWALAPLEFADVDQYVRRYGETYGLHSVQKDVGFVFQWAGGHPGLLEGVCRILGEVEETRAAVVVENRRNGGNQVESAATGRQGDRRLVHQAAVERLSQDQSLQSECAKIWQACSSEERAALAAFVSGDAPSGPAALANLQRAHILLDVDGRLRLFSRLFANYVRRIQGERRESHGRLWVDVESGQVLLDGEPAETLTKLEYQLMLLLFENRDKILDKYQIVTGVWGEEYIDEVDDARIEKLVSRLRQKVEPDPGNPRFITTVRGRGYRLVLFQ